MNQKFVYILTTLICFFIATESAFAQPSNDECDTAIEIPNVVNWCSDIEAYTNSLATPSGFGAPLCFSDSDNDIWFRFTAVATDVTITVIGNTPFPTTGGTLNEPEVALYIGDCGGTINTLGCESDATTGNNTIQLYEGGMIVGQEYILRIDSDLLSGSFQLCISNYFAPVDPGSDCPDAAILCDKSEFVVQSVTGAGNDPDEAAGTCLGNLGQNSESNSTWFTWTCSQSGPLTFTLTPSFPSDDLDFVVYELPNGIANCTGKIPLRCMASGDSVFPSDCMGPTGLSATATDVLEELGCNQPYPQDNFLQALDMVQGTSYALVINNFTSTGNGFAIEFGGAGLFLGPEADMEIDEPDQVVCFSETVTFNDNSTFALGALVGWEWNFGVDAVPPTASGQGPHEVTWSTSGTKTAVLTVQSNLGCIVVDVETIQVDPCCETFNLMTAVPTVEDINCPDVSDGSISLNVSSNSEPHVFEWSNNANTFSISGLSVGDYTVTITNQAMCDTVLTYSIASPPPFNFTPQIVMPTCDGGQDGAIEILGFGGTPPYQYQWQNSGVWTADNTLTNIPVGNYIVIIEDDLGCQTTLIIPVNELELELQLGGTTAASCFSLADGAIEIIIENGIPPYQYNFNLGAGFQSSNILDNIPAGTYTIDVLDGNLCEGNFEIMVSEPPPIAVTLDPVDVSCSGAGDGMIEAMPEGGVGNYVYNWSNGETTATISNLEPGTYSVTVLDGNDCDISDQVTITEPGELFISVIDVVDVICFGDETGSVTVEGTGGNPPFQYSVDGVIFQDAATLANLGAGDYTITVQDDLGCTAEVDATITQPEQLIVDAGEDVSIDLGFSTNLNVAFTPFGFVTYEWIPADGLSCTDCPNPIASPVNTTTYTIIITDEMGCTASDQVTVEVVKNRPIYIPNAFSPNFDGNNDFFTVYGGLAAASIKELRIFNRWGALVFEAEGIPLNEPTLGWNGVFKGKEMTPDVFAFYTYVEFIDGEVVLYEGDLTLMK